MSERRIDDFVEIPEKGSRVEHGQSEAPADEDFQRNRLSAQRPELGYGLSGSGDRDPLSLGGAIDDVAAVITKFPDRNVCHDASVSRVIHTVTTVPAGFPVEVG